MFYETKVNTKNKYFVRDYDGNDIECPYWTNSNFDLEDSEFASALAYKLNGDIENGYYIEIGVGDYKKGNSTYFLETYYNWKGVSVDYKHNLFENFNNNRKNPCIHDNALSFDWYEYLSKNNFPKIINFLSIDIDTESGDNANLLALLNLPLTQYKFKVIIIEHNAGVNYRLTKYRDLQREILTALGYSLLVPGDVDDLWVFEQIGAVNGFDQLHRVLKGML